MSGNEERKDESDLSALLAVNADKAGLIITQFMLFMQQKSIWPCHQFIGDDPQPITTGEAMKLKREYVELLKDS
jgi:hypothetical protein